MDRRSFLRMVGITAAASALPMDTLESLATPARAAVPEGMLSGELLTNTLQSQLEALAEDVAYLHGDLQHIQYRALHLPRVAPGSVAGLQEKQTIIDAMLSTRKSQEMMEQVEAMEQTSEFLRAHRAQIQELAAEGKLQIPKLLDADGAAIPEFERQGLRSALDASKESARSYYARLQQQYGTYRTQIANTAKQVFHTDLEDMDELFRRADENDREIDHVSKAGFAETMQKLGAYTIISPNGKFHEGPNQIVIDPAGKSKETLRAQLSELQEALEELTMDGLEESVPLGANRLLLRLDYSDPGLAREATAFLQQFSPMKTNLLARG